MAYSRTCKLRRRRALRLAIEPLEPRTVLSGGPVANVASHIVVFHEGLDVDSAVGGLAQAHGLSVTNVYRHALSGMAAIVPEGRVAALASDPRVALVEPNQSFSIEQQSIPTGIRRAGADQNSTASIDGGGALLDVDIAIIDTGIDLDHADLNVYKWTNCATGGPLNQSCKDGDSNANDGNGHGTHVAGTAAARDNGMGVVGMAPGARLWAVKVLGNDGSGWTNWIIGGIDYVTAHAGEIEVANMSLGGSASSAIDTAVKNSIAAGVTYAVAAGNSRSDAKDFSPARVAEAITVSALADFDGKPGGLNDVTVQFSSCTENQDDSFACFSNFGAVIDIMAPGVLIQSTWKDGGYNTISGTSMASPHVAGAAALYLVENPGATPAQVRDGLVAAGDLAPCDTPGGKCNDDPDGIQEPLLDVANTTSEPDTTAPAAPTALVATAGDGQVALDWADNSESDLAGYNVHRRTDIDPYAEIASLVGVSQYTDNSASNGTTYFYVVTAEDTSGNKSGNSNEVSATPAAAETPSETVHVGNLTGAPTESKNTWAAVVTVTIHDANHSGAGAGYDVVGNWSGGYSGSGSCTTASTGQCTVQSGSVPKRISNITFTVTDVNGASTYNAADNEVTSITVFKDGTSTTAGASANGSSGSRKSTPSSNSPFFQALAAREPEVAAVGDANRDGAFDEQDIVQVLQAGKYLTGKPADWADGDWDGDGVFDQLDLVMALQAGRYLGGNRTGGDKTTADTVFDILDESFARLGV